MRGNRDTGTTADQVLMTYNSELELVGSASVRIRGRYEMLLMT